MIQVPEELLEEIKDVINQNCLKGEKGWSYAEYEEDTIVGDFLGNLRTEKKVFEIGKNVYEWEIIYKKFQGRGNNAYESKSGADGIITYEITDKLEEVKTIKSIIFQAKKRNNNQDLHEQKAKMDKIAQKGNFVLRLGPNGYFAEQGDEANQRIADFLTEKFLACKTGIEGMSFDPIRKELKFNNTNFIHFGIDQRLLIKVDQYHYYR